MKPILFNTDMARAILEDRKTVTRRVVKPQPSSECSHKGPHEFIRDDFIEGSSFTGFVCKKCGYGVCGPHFKFPIGTSCIRPPYRPGDILYVRETFSEYNGEYIYQASVEQPKSWNGLWRPSVWMPREAARIFLRVTNMSVAKLRDITDSDILAEGVQSKKPDWLRLDFADVWNNTIKSADLALYGWDANPWVWAVEFERISREEVESHEG